MPRNILKKTFFIAFLWGASLEASQNLKEATGSLEPRQMLYNLWKGDITSQHHKTFIPFLLLPFYPPQELVSIFEEPYSASNSLLLPQQMRNQIVSYNPFILHLTWLLSLKEQRKRILFQPRDMQLLFENIQKIQNLISQKRQLNFREILSAVCSDIEDILKRKQAHLKPQNSKQKPWNLDQAATAWLSFFDPTKYDKETLFKVLRLASQFKIDASLINPELWRKPEILQNIASMEKASLDDITFVANLRLEIPVDEEDVYLELKDHQSLTIQNLKGDMKLLSELIALFPETRHLDISFNDIPSLNPLLSTLKTLTNLQALSLSANPLQDFSGLSGFSQLTSLDISHTDIFKVSSLEKLKEILPSENALPNLTSLKIRHTFQNLHGNTDPLTELFALFPQITNLDISESQITSLKSLVSPLKTLTNLQTLNLSVNPLHNFSALGELPQITSLDLSDTYIFGVSSCRKFRNFLSSENPLPTLKKLTVKHRSEECQEIAEYLKWQELEQIHTNFSRLALDLLNKSTIDNIDEKISYLNHLAKHWDQTLGIPPIGLNWKDLFSILSDYDPGEPAFQLLFAWEFNLPVGTVREKLRFIDNQPTADAKSLTCLSISGACLKFEEGQNEDIIQEKSKKLEEIRRTFLPSLKIFGSLTQLYLCTLQLTTLRNLPRLPYLQLLDVSDNQIKSLKRLLTNNLHKFPKLTIFRMANNQLTNDPSACLKYLLDLPLIGLDLSGNHLTELPKLGKLSLRRFDIHNNNIPPDTLKGYQNKDGFTYSPQRDNQK